MEEARETEPAIRTIEKAAAVGRADGAGATEAYPIVKRPFERLKAVLLSVWEQLGPRATRRGAQRMLSLVWVHENMSYPS